MYRIAHELLGQLGKTDLTWTTEIVPAGLMRQIILDLESGQINGQLSRSLLFGVFS